ncbi:Nif3-like dinuclear metal center hexameric protein [Fusibacillus kribbianus]|uniref:GTP cyclohydrolase 1 type 2 homolog n=1 Tax=Fusibacillus kribbianus TaxID=3044208 RepID=A0AAP4B8W8_9FIRM|nr:Nif3-like dinuclear metal center hexameric protein [Ruminococcus sp. YH-rum2234]MDI9241397.1 Nif3-like dinuclear metal center hexameric protein [Ruminococcus sp. YH-rum2234]
MKTCGEIRDWFNERWPESLACQWDNVGLLVGRAGKEIQKIYVTLDVTDEDVEAAVSMGADMILSHHPLIFGPVKRINDADPHGRRLLTLIREDICCYGGHTSFDIAKGGMADLAAERLGLFDEKKPLEPLEATAEQDGEAVGIGKVGFLKEPMTVEALARTVKERFQIPAVTVYGDFSEKRAGRIAVSPGSGKSMMKEAVRAGVDVLITGDMGHHEGLDLAAEGISLIDAGHYGLEHIFVEEVAKALEEEQFGLEVVRAPLHYPCRVI